MKIGSSNDSEAVKVQYSTSNRLNTRISFHDKCSTNKQGFGNWIVSNYDIKDGGTFYSATFKSVMDLPIEKIRDILNGHVENGAIDLPKEYGMFICK